MKFIIIYAVVLLLIFIAKTYAASKKHSAVHNAFLAKYTYQKMTDDQRKIVKEMMFEILDRGGLLKDDFKLMTELMKYSFLALAMFELKITPALQNEEWHYVKNPCISLINSEHQISVVEFYFQKHHNVNITFKGDS